MQYTRKQLEDLFIGIFEGDITTRKIPVELYMAIADDLKGGLYKGFGGGLVEFGGQPLQLLENLRENIYMFSGAKSYQEVRAMQDALAAPDGSVRTRSQFFKECDRLNEQYNVNWRAAEYDTCIASGQCGYRWTEIEAQKDILPYITLSVVEDQNTSAVCAPLDKLTAPVGHPVWAKYYPPNHFYCRTLATQTDDKSQLWTPAAIRKATETADKDMADLFKMNVGKDGYVFSQKHNYFEVEPKDRALAKRNFNLPIPEKD